MRTMMAPSGKKTANRADRRTWRVSFQDLNRVHYATYPVSQHNALGWISISSLFTSGGLVGVVTASIRKDEYSYDCVRMVSNAQGLESNYRRKR